MKQWDWNTKPLITITTSVQGAIHEKSITILNNNMRILKPTIKNLLKTIHQNAIKYLTYLILNKRKLDPKQAFSQHLDITTTGQIS